MRDLLLTTLNQALKSYLALDPESAARLHGLAGKVITIRLKPIAVTLQCVFTANGLHLQSGEELLAQATIEGTPLQLLGAAGNQSQRSHFFAEGLTISGEAELAQQLMQLFDALEIDLEHVLAPWLGDIAAYHGNRIFKNARQWLQDSQENFKTSLTDYIHEEAGWLPPKAAVADFFAQVDELRVTVDRLEARIKQLPVK